MVGRYSYLQAARYVGRAFYKWIALWRYASQCPLLMLPGNFTHRRDFSLQSICSSSSSSTLDCSAPPKKGKDHPARPPEREDEKKTTLARQPYPPCRYPSYAQCRIHFADIPPRVLSRTHRRTVAAVGTLIPPVSNLRRETNAVRYLRMCFIIQGTWPLLLQPGCS